MTDSPPDEVERLAEAIWATEDMGYLPWSEFSHEFRDTYRSYARAALAALRVVPPEGETEKLRAALVEAHAEIAAWTPTRRPCECQVCKESRAAERGVSAVPPTEEPNE